MGEAVAAVAAGGAGGAGSLRMIFGFFFVGEQEEDAGILGVWRDGRLGWHGIGWNEWNMMGRNE